VPQGELAKVIFTLTNSSDADAVVSLGCHADVMIGNNDSAPISRRIDTIGNTYGLSMIDGSGAQLCLLFGEGLVGVTAVDDFWFGFYSLNSSNSEIVGNYSSGSYYMEENGSYDSGMGWCWKNRTIPANSSVEISYLIGVGDVNLEPTSSFEVTPDDVDGWNDLSRPHVLTLEGEYESPAGQKGRIEYAVEDSEDWIALTGELESGSNFTATLTAQFVTGRETHLIRFRTVDGVGNTSLLTPISYKDVSYVTLEGIENKTYNFGEQVYQTNLSCSLASDHYAIKNYSNNVNVGTATFKIEGVFPYTIGRKQYSFNIESLPLSGGIEVDAGNYVYDGQPKTPSWKFSDSRFANLKEDVDYQQTYSNNIYPGKASIKVSGINNFSNAITTSFTIGKAELADNLYKLNLPGPDVTYDGNAHLANPTSNTGVGTISFTYINHDTNATVTSPTEVGTYDVYYVVAEGSYYLGKERTYAGSFTIYNLSDEDWASIKVLKSELETCGKNMDAWDTSNISKATNLSAFTFEGGRVVGIDLSNYGLEGDFPTSISRFSTIKVLNLSNNKFTGNPGVLAAALPKLESLDVSNNHIRDLYPAISSKVTTLNLSSQDLSDYTMTLNLANATAEALSSQIPSIVMYNHSTQSYDKAVEFECTAANGWKALLNYADGQLSASAMSSNYDYHGANGDKLDVKAYSNDTEQLGTFKMALEFEQGDANFDGKIDATDLQSTILHIFNSYNSIFNFTAADTYVDNTINVQDVVCTVNILLTSTQQSTDGSINNGSSTKSTRAKNISAYICAEDGVVKIYTPTPIAALSIKTSGNVDWHLDNFGMTQTVAYNAVAAYSITGATIPAGETVIGSYNGTVDILSTSLADEAAQRIDAGIVTNGYESLINDIKADVGADADAIYDLNGRRLGANAKGFIIIKRGNQSQKIYNTK
jgi:hypothetical protein